MIVDIKKQVFELLCEIANKYGNGDYSGYGCPILLYKDENGDAYFGILSPDIYKDDWYYDIYKSKNKDNYDWLIYIMPCVSGDMTMSQVETYLDNINYMLFTLRVINFCQRHNIILNIKKDKNGHKQFRSVKI